MWTKESLQQLIKDKMSDYLFIVVSNRQPYIHVFKKGKVECQRGAGGVITALDPVMQACHGIWVAHGNGEADRKVTDEKGKIKVPESNHSYTLKRVWLTKEEVRKGIQEEQAIIVFFTFFSLLVFVLHLCKTIENI